MGEALIRIEKHKKEKLQFYRSKQTTKMANKLIQTLNRYKPVWVMGALLVVSHIGWKQLQTVEGIHPSGPDAPDHPWPITRFLVMAKGKLTGSSSLMILVKKISGSCSSLSGSRVRKIFGGFFERGLFFPFEVDKPGRRRAFFRNLVALGLPLPTRLL